MANIESHITPEELENNYEYKVVKRALMKEFPYIKGVELNPEELDRYNLIFLNLIVDPIQMKETYGYEFNPWLIRRLEAGERYTANYPSLLYNVTYEDSKEDIMNPINKMMEQIHNSAALPHDMTLPKGRRFSVGSFIVNPNGPSW